VTENSPPAEHAGNLAEIMRVLRNPAVRRLQIASFGSTLGDWAYATAIVVWAYQHGGAAAVGGYQAARFVAMAVAGPLGGAIADRMSRQRFMVATDTVRAVLVGLAAVAIASDGPPSAIYALAIVTATVGAPFRAAQAGLLPELVDSPEDLAAANAIAGNLENITIFAGPALAGLLLAAGNVQAVLWLNVGSFIWSNLLLLTVRTKATRSSDAGQAEGSRGYWSDVSAGFGLVRRSPDLRNVAVMAGAFGFAWGASTVFMVLLATDVLKSGPEGLGYLNAVLGIAIVVGGVLVLGRVSTSRLGQGIEIGALGWAVPLLAVAAFPSPVTAVAAIAVIGVTEPFSDLAFETIPQRIAPPDFVSRVYAAVDCAAIAPMAAGALVAPAIVDHAGLRISMGFTGAVVLAVLLTRWLALRQLDQRLKSPEGMEVLTAPVIGLVPRHHWNGWHMRRISARYGKLRRY